MFIIDKFLRIKLEYSLLNPKVVDRSGNRLCPEANLTCNVRGLNPRDTTLKKTLPNHYCGPKV